MILDPRTDHLEQYLIDKVTLDTILTQLSEDQRTYLTRKFGYHPSASDHPSRSSLLAKPTRSTRRMRERIRRAIAYAQKLAGETGELSTDSGDSKADAVNRKFDILYQLDRTWLHERASHLANGEYHLTEELKQIGRIALWDLCRSATHIVGWDCKQYRRSSMRYAMHKFKQKEGQRPSYLSLDDL